MQESLSNTHADDNYEKLLYEATLAALDGLLRLGLCSYVAVAPVMDLITASSLGDDDELEQLCQWLKDNLKDASNNWVYSMSRWLRTIERGAHLLGDLQPPPLLIEASRQVLETWAAIATTEKGEDLSFFEPVSPDLIKKWLLDNIDFVRRVPVSPDFQNTIAASLTSEPNSLLAQTIDPQQYHYVAPIGPATHHQGPTPHSQVVVGQAAGSTFEHQQDPASSIPKQETALSPSPYSESESYPLAPTQHTPPPPQSFTPQLSQGPPPAFQGPGATHQDVNFEQPTTPQKDSLTQVNAVPPQQQDPSHPTNHRQANIDLNQTIEHTDPPTKEPKLGLDLEKDDDSPLISGI